MIRTALATLAVSAVLTVSPASAITPPTFTVSDPALTSAPITLTATSPCACRYTWRAYQTSRYDGTGFPLADTYSPVVNVRIFTAGVYAVVLKQTSAAVRGGASSTQNVRVVAG